MPTLPQVDAYIAAQAEFARPILIRLRALVHAACPEAEEAIKWRMPVFLYRGKMLANMAAFKAHATFGFWAGKSLETGREGEAMGQFGRMTSCEDIPDDDAFAAMVHAAMARIEAGVPHRPKRAPKPEAVVPAELAEALADSPDAAAHFAAFSPACRREYCEWIGEAKREETRCKRAAEAAAWIAQGKKRNWKYENC